MICQSKAISRLADAGSGFSLLLNRCEKGVMSLVNVRNCIRFYQTAEELNASTLMNYCAEIIASHWVSSGEASFCFSPLRPYSPTL